MIPPMTTDEFKRRVTSMNPNIEVLSDYQGYRAKVVRKCKNCGDVRSVSARTLLEGHKCIVCTAAERAKGLRKTHKQFLKELSDLNPNVEVLTEYVTNNTKVKCRCLIDGYEWDAEPHVLLQGHGCPECGRQRNEIASKPRLTHEEFVEVIHSKFPSIKVTSQYKNTESYVSYECEVCGYQWSAVSNTLLHCSEKGCPCCSGNIRISEGMLIERLAKTHPELEYLGGYTTMSEQVHFGCTKCGYTWKALPTNVLKRSGCPKCSASLGVQKIAQHLVNRGIKFVTEYRYPDCRAERPLPFDFYLPEHNTLIEYDGEQHFMPVRFYNCTQEQAEAKLRATQYRDSIKDEYCKRHDITLIRIPYTDFDKITEILDKYIP